MTDVLHSHPVVGGTIAVVLTVFGTAVKFFDTLLQLELPLLFMQILQCTAWIGAICVSGITIHGWYKKHFGK